MRLLLLLLLILSRLWLQMDILSKRPELRRYFSPEVEQGLRTAVDVPKTAVNNGVLRYLDEPSAHPLRKFILGLLRLGPRSLQKALKEPLTPFASIDDTQALVCLQAFLKKYPEQRYFRIFTMLRMLSDHPTSEIVIGGLEGFITFEFDMATNDLIPRDLARIVCEYLGGANHFRYGVQLTRSAIASFNWKRKQWERDLNFRNEEEEEKKKRKAFMVEEDPPGPHTKKPKLSLKNNNKKPAAAASSSTAADAAAAL